MSFSRSLLLRLAAALLPPLLIEGYFYGAFFPLTGAHRETADTGVPIAELAYCVLVAIYAAVLARPVAAGLAQGASPEARRRGAVAAQRLPTRLTAASFLTALVLAAAVVGAELRQDLAVDLVGAGAATAVAFAIMSAGLAYSVATGLSATALVALGSADLRGGGSVRWKVLVLCCSLVTMTALMLAGVAYARYRADADRQYVQVAVSAQDHAARWIEQRGADAAAELVRTAAGAPTVVLGPQGQLLGHAGGDVPALAAAASNGPGLEPVQGGWRLRRPVGAATLVSFLPEAPLEGRRAAFFGDATVLGVLLVCGAGLLVWLAAQSLTAPLRLLGRAADGIAAGDLTVSAPKVTRDEVGQLAADFRRMTQGLSVLVRDVQAASQGVHDGTREMAQIGDRVQGGAREEHHRVEAVHDAVEAMHGSVGLVSAGVEGLSEYVHSTRAAVGEMAAALEEVRRHATELERRIEAADADADKLSDAGRRAQAQVGALDGLAAEAQETVASVSRSLSRLEASAVGSQLAAAQAAEMADSAGTVVNDAVAGMEALRGAVGDAKQRVAALGRRSDDIDQILDFIGEVAGRTNLLSLNASIIATQAGEHGKAFAVVAEQIRELAAQISSSTKSIASIIGAVRDDVDGTARLIDHGDELASRGVAQARRSLQALQDIRTATARGHETAAAILEAVQAHGQSTRAVSELVAQAGDSTRALSEALQMVGRSVAAVASVSKGVRGVADKVARALDEQSGLGRRQMQNLERIDGMLTDITQAVAAHQATTRRVRDVLAQLTRTAHEQEGVVVELAAVAERMGGRSRALAQSVDRFKI
jgi:methyl-accepting chemotaxis protein